MNDSQWTDADWSNAISKHWMLSCDHECIITWTNKPDQTATEYVKQLADEGDETAQKALVCLMTKKLTCGQI